MTNGEESTRIQWVNVLAIHGQWFSPGSPYSEIMKRQYLHLQDVFEIHSRFNFNMQWRSVIFLFFEERGEGG